MPCTQILIVHHNTLLLALESLQIKSHRTRYALRIDHRERLNVLVLSIASNDLTQLELLGELAR